MLGKDSQINHPAVDSQSSSWQGFVYVSEAVTNPSSGVGVAVEGLANSPDATVFSLSEAQVGDRVQIVALNCGEANNRLMGMGFMPNVVLEVISCTATGSVVVALQDQRLGLGAEMAHQIQVMHVKASLNESSNPSVSPSTTRIATMQPTPQVPMVKLRDAAIGSRLRVVGYEPTARDYKRKLLAMGLTPDTELRVTRHAPLGDPTEIEVRHFHLSLRKDEADALIVTPVTGEES
ncbi:MAG: ferrous iron transport protein A [Cyanobacteria bacterium]|nr:ferrous iron transport protein A [Cyanobacteriota bacterium]MDW8200724.1 FeoA family protein [Cyanobacteriota bacterium SKYGB_h_bin112]